MVSDLAAAWDALETDFGGAGLIRRGFTGDLVGQMVGPVYLATPFTKLATGPDGQLVPLRAKLAARAAAKRVADFANAGVSAFSPIVLSWAACDADGWLNPLDQDFWMRWCEPFLAACTAVVVPAIPGWRDSDGVLAEVTWALRRNRPVFLVDGWVGDRG